MMTFTALQWTWACGLATESAQADETLWSSCCAAPASSRLPGLVYDRTPGSPPDHPIPRLRLSFPGFLWLVPATPMPSTHGRPADLHPWPAPPSYSHAHTSSTPPGRPPVALDLLFTFLLLLLCVCFSLYLTVFCSRTIHSYPARVGSSGAFCRRHSLTAGGELRLFTAILTPFTLRNWPLLSIPQSWKNSFLVSLRSSLYLETSFPKSTRSLFKRL